MLIFKSNYQIITKIDRLKEVLYSSNKYHSCIEIGDKGYVFTTEVELSLIGVIDVVFSFIYKLRTQRGKLIG